MLFFADDYLLRNYRDAEREKQRQMEAHIKNVVIFHKNNFELDKLNALILHNNIYIII